jgi:hypothetical protein
MPIALALYNDNGGLINIRKPKSSPFLRAASEFKKVQKELQHPRLRRAKGSLEALAAACVADNFARMEDADGVSWPPLAASTIGTKIGKSKSGGGNFSSGGKVDVTMGRDAKGRYKREETLTKGSPRRRKFPTRDKEGLVIGAKRRSLEEGVPSSLAQRRRLDARQGIKRKSDVGWGGGDHATKMIANIGSGQFLPLVDTGALYKSVAMPFNRTATSSMSTVTAIPFNQNSSPLNIDFRNKRLSIVPKEFGKRMQEKFKLHNRKVASGVLLPGREFFYLKQADLTLIGDVLFHLTLIGDRERDEYYWPRQPKRGTYSKTTYKEKSKGIKATTTAVKHGGIEGSGTNQKKPFSIFMQRAIAKNKRAAGIVASQTDPMGWIDEYTKRRMSETGVFEFAVGVASIGATQRHLNKRKGRR